MKRRTDIDGLLAVSNDKDTYAIVLDKDAEDAGFFVMMITLDGRIIRSVDHSNLQDALRDYISQLDLIRT